MTKPDSVQTLFRLCSEWTPIEKRDDGFFSTPFIGPTKAFFRRYSSIICSFTSPINRCNNDIGDSLPSFDFLGRKCGFQAIMGDSVTFNGWFEGNREALSVCPFTIVFLSSSAVDRYNLVWSISMVKRVIAHAKSVLSPSSITLCSQSGHSLSTILFCRDWNHNL